MSEAMHTPGEWLADPEPMVPRRRQWAQTHVSAGPRVVATVFRDGPDVTDDDVARVAADARLIAACPAMYAALELLLLIDANGIGHVIDVLPAVEAARAAVAKAKGESS